METSEHPLYHFIEFTEEIHQVYNREGLQDLHQIKDNGARLSSTFSTVLNRKHNIHPIPYSIFKIEDELRFITQDIKYVTGILFYLRPYIIDITETNGRYNQNTADHKYLTYANFGLQIIYNYWDRIGDILHLYFETGLPITGVYLSKVLNNLKPTVKQEQAYIDLNDLYQVELKGFMEERHSAVHYYQLESKYFWGNIELSGEANRVEREALNAEKHSYPEKFKKHLELCITGFRLMLNLIDTLPNMPLPSPSVPASTQ